MNAIILHSPAKLNLYLKILKKRKDGFHNISTIFQRIDLCDTITFKSNKTGKIKITCNHPHVPVGSKNLVYQVAKAFQEDFGIKKGVDIKIKKRIPVAAGLAGGSSNAATALLGLNKLWNLGLKNQKLLTYAKKIGSDIAFFIYDTSWAHGTERGDRIRRVHSTSILHQILVVPKVKMYSGRVYGGFKLQLTKQHDNANICIRNLKNHNILKQNELLFNDLQKVVFKLCPSLLKLKQRLKALGFQGVMVSGSGPAVFGLAEDEKQAKHAKKILENRYSQVFVVKTL